MKCNRPFVAALAFAVSPLQAAPSLVKTEKSELGWKLLVNGAPYLIKGVGCNTSDGADKEDYLQMAKDMGANSVRTWSFTPRAYFDRAQALGLTVDAGVWFNPARAGMADSYQDTGYRSRLKTATLDYVKKMKDHPALLMWNLGNEVFNFTESDAERKAFALFLEDLIRQVHAEDPNHPVVFACASAIDLTYLKNYVPSLDIVGANTYGNYAWVPDWLKREKFDRPVVATEFGPYGEWDRMKDANQQPYDPADHDKAKNYEDEWRAIEQTPEQSLGGYAFVVGDLRNQASLTWYNLNYKNKKRDAYWTMYKLYTGQEPANRAPRIKLLSVDRVKDLNPGDTIALTVKASDPDGDPIAYDYFITDIIGDPLIVAPARFYPCSPQSTEPGVAQLRVPNEPGVYRVYAAVTDDHGNIAFANRSIEVNPLTH